MPKRKRPDSGEDPAARAMRLLKEDAQAKLEQSKTLIRRALKAAKGFERQKLAKRLRAATAANEADKMARINREIEALKGLDLQKATDAHLYAKLLKIKVFNESIYLPEEVRVPIEKPQGSEEQIAALRNVVSGLFNMKDVKAVLEQVLQGMYIALGIPAPASTSRGKRAKKEEVQLKGILQSPVNLGISRSTGAEDVNMLDEADEDNEDWEGFSPGNEAEDGEEGGSGHDSLDEEELSRYDALLGASSEDESFDEEEYKKRPGRQAPLSLSLSPEPFDAGSPSPASSTSPSPEPESRPAKISKVVKPKAPIKVGASTFLPSLMNTYMPGSDSEASDIEEDEPRPVRKNRPGQMARRAIWEKKYKEQANHIKSGQGPANPRKDDGWDAKRGAKDTTRGVRRGGPMNRSERRSLEKRSGGKVTGENSIPVGVKAKTRDDVGVLHPSWQAAKKAKEEKKAATFSGKKITF